MCVGVVTLLFANFLWLSQAIGPNFGWASKDSVVCVIKGAQLCSEPDFKQCTSMNSLTAEHLTKKDLKGLPDVENALFVRLCGANNVTGWLKSGDRQECGKPFDGCADPAGISGENDHSKRKKYLESLRWFIEQESIHVNVQENKIDSDLMFPPMPEYQGPWIFFSLLFVCFFLASFLFMFPAALKWGVYFLCVLLFALLLLTLYEEHKVAYEKCAHDKSFSFQLYVNVCTNRDAIGDRWKGVAHWLKVVVWTGSEVEILTPDGRVLNQECQTLLKSCMTSCKISWLSIFFGIIGRAFGKGVGGFLEEFLSLGNLLAIGFIMICSAACIATIVLVASPAKLAMLLMIFTKRGNERALCMIASGQYLSIEEPRSAAQTAETVSASVNTLPVNHDRNAFPPLNPPLNPIDHTSAALNGEPQRDN